MFILNLRIIESTRVEITTYFFYNSPPSHHVLASWSSKWQRTQSLHVPRKVPLSAVSPPCSLPSVSQPQKVLQAPAWPRLTSTTPAVPEPLHGVCWDTGCSLLYASNYQSVPVNTQIKQHLSQQASRAGCCSSWKIKATRCHTIILYWMSLLGTKPMAYGHQLFFLGVCSMWKRG